MTDKQNQRGFLGIIIFLTILAILAGGGILVAVNLGNSIPGDLIYPIKGIFEELKISYTELNDENRARVYIDLSNTRLGELERLASRRDYDRIGETLNRMTLMQERALDYIDRAQGNTRNINSLISQFSYVESKLKSQQDVLQKLHYEVTSQIYEAMDQAIASTQKNLDRLDTIKRRI